MAAAARAGVAVSTDLQEIPMNVFATPASCRLLGTLAPEASGKVACDAFFTPRPPPPQPWELPVQRSARAVTLCTGTNALLWGAGPIVLMMHGWDGRATQFARMVPRLVAAGRTVVALHAPGHGSAPDGLSVLGFMRTLLAAGRDLGEVEAVVGHSMGGAAALFAASEGLRCRRIVTLSSPSALSDAMHRYAAALALPARAQAAFMRAADRRLGLPASALDVASVVPGLSRPVLMVHDRGDRSVPYADALRIAAALPQARLRSTEGMRHTLALQDAGVVRDVCEFVLARERAAPPLALAS
jgi:pimeloyl-ACP methyl ester carboxylesterase